MVFPVTHLSSLSSLSYCLFSLLSSCLLPMIFFLVFLPSLHCQSSSTSYHLSFSYTSAFLLLRASLFSSGSGFLLLSVCLSSLSLSLFLSLLPFLSSSPLLTFSISSSSFLSVQIFLAFSSSCSHPLNFFNFLLSLASYSSLPLFFISTSSLLLLHFLFALCHFPYHILPLPPLPFDKFIFKNIFYFLDIK